MKTIIFLSAVFFGAFVQARSLHPCTPTVQAKPSRLSCVQNDKIYSIKIETLMSPAKEMCRGDQLIEISTAYIQIANLAGETLAKVEVLDNAFSYSLGLPGMDAGYFKSEALSLDLEKCATPAHGGGFSGGN